MSNWIPFLSLLAVAVACAYFRVGLRGWTLASVGAIVAVAFLSDAHPVAQLIPAVLFAAIAVPLNHTPLRRRYLVEPALKFYARMTPQLSPTVIPCT